MRLPKLSALVWSGAGVCTLAGGLVIWKDFISGSPEQQFKDKKVKSQEGKVFVVTGANSGN